MCDFCDKKIIQQGLIYTADNFYIRYDAEPVSAGHLLIIPKRHIVSVQELNVQEKTEFWQVLDKAIYFLKTSQPGHPQDFNIGINEGRLAGRTIDHLHIHVIPRYEGDLQNPAGGIRNILPNQGEK